MIEREMVQQMFDEMIGEGVDTNAEMLWGYYFTDPDAEKLEGVVPALESKGFEFVELLEAEPEDGGDKFFVLHIERLEAHTVDSLHQLNQELEEFSIKYSLESYDGMDVSPMEEVEDFDDDLDDEDDDLDDEEMDDDFDDEDMDDEDLDDDDEDEDEDDDESDKKKR